MNESDLLTIIRNTFSKTIPAGAHQFVDDVAHLPPCPSNATRVITCDMLVEEKDFSLRLSPAKSAGHRAMIQNLSDLASAGAQPVGMVWSLALPASWLANQAQVLQDFLVGAAAVALNENIPLLGGDLSSTEGPMVVSTTALGDVYGNPLLRSGAQPGDSLWLSRWIGGSACGLRMLLYPPADAQQRHPCLNIHEYPTAETLFAQELVNKATSCMDISDGLAKDLHRLCRASKCGAQLFEEDKFVHPAASVDDAYFGGEDYALLFTYPKGERPSRGIHIGEMNNQKKILTHNKNVLPDQGYEHFSTEHISTKNKDAPK